MRILFRGTVHATSLAKSLKKALAARGHDVGIRTCENHVAAMTGYATWHELAAVCAANPDPSPRDDEVDPAVAAARRDQYAARLATHYGAGTALSIVDALMPSGRKAAPPASARYVATPYTNAEFDARRRADPKSDFYARVFADKGGDGPFTTGSEAASALAHALDFDPTVGAILPTPLRLDLKDGPRSATVIPDFSITTIGGHSWHVLFATPNMLAASGEWIASAAAGAMSDLGKRLVVVAPSVMSLPTLKGAGFGEARSRNVRMLPELGADILRVVNDGPEGGVPIMDVAMALRDLGWPGRDPDMLRAVGGSDVVAAYARIAVGMIFRAVRESYVDHDPATAEQGIHGLIVRRHTFLESHAVLGQILSHAIASTDPVRLRAIDAGTRKMVTSVPEGLRFEGSSIVGTPIHSGSFKPYIMRP